MTPHHSRTIAFGVIALNVVLAAVTFLKGKLMLGLASDLHSGRRPDRGVPPCEAALRMVPLVLQHSPTKAGTCPPALRGASRLGRALQHLVHQPRRRRAEPSLAGRGADERELGSGQQASRVEQREGAVLLAEHRLGDEVAAHECEDVPVPRIAAAYPGAFCAGDGPTTGMKSRTRPKIPAHRCVT